MFLQVRVSHSGTEPHAVLKEGQEAHWEVGDSLHFHQDYIYIIPLGCRKNFIYSYKST